MSSDRGFDFETKTVLVAAASRNRVEEVAQDLKELGAPPRVWSHEEHEYTCIDAGALLVRVARGIDGLLDQLVDAVKRRDLEGFVAALEAKGAASLGVLRSMRTAARAKDQGEFAALLRQLGDPELGELLAQDAKGRVVGWEVSKPSDELMGCGRRGITTSYLSSYTVPLCTAPVRNWGLKDRDDREAVMYCAGELGYDTCAWERECLFHPYILDVHNASMDLMQESRGMGYIDGRTDGTRGTGVSIWG
mmetsp:Transcript_38640/g.109267  ORF Transcript_38640/g.109267 Transcript_38640/m.109267 type:complete len:249 (-) Transcript_38640:70-816(-)